MAEDSSSSEDKSEEATPERREEFRDKGNIAVSKEITSAIILLGLTIFMTYYFQNMAGTMKALLRQFFEESSTPNLNSGLVLNLVFKAWLGVLWIVIPVFLVDSVLSIASTLIQTRFNWSWEKVSPDFSRMNPFSGLVRMMSVQALVDLGKSLAKMAAVAIVAWLVLLAQWPIVPKLMNVSIMSSWAYWAQISNSMFWSVGILLIAIGILDYFYNFITLERKMRMSKQEVKEEYKKREADPHVKARIRRVQRDIAMAKAVAKTKEATVVVTNPDHYAVAIKYELGMAAPLVVAKGVDFMAQKIKEVAKENSIPIVENKALARTLFKLVEVGHEIPDSLYKAVSEVIRYVFKIKGIKINRQTKV